MSSDADHHATLVRGPGGSAEPGRRTSSWTLPADLQGETVRRLRAVALVYALAFFLAGPFISLLFPAGRAMLVEVPRLWVPSALSIALALGFAALLSHGSISNRLKVRLGLAFEVLASVGITAAEYHHIAAPISYGSYGAGGFGLSWVAPWVMLFSVVIPAPARVALVSGALSLLAVPLTYLAGVATGSNVALHPGEVFLNLVFPYLVVLMMAYVGARVVYGLGTAVRKARELGSYQLVERLGQGGMGEVWRAQHRMLARPAAIKLIRPEVLGGRDPESRRQVLHRFEREAQATALMRSSHTMELYDYGVAEDGTFYYVMELLDGFDLDRLVQRFGPVPPERAVHFLLQMCHSLAEAHEAGLIHRDVKPANVFVCRYGREVDFIKVLDFGLVKHHNLAEKNSEQLTLGDAGSGTPAFMSPEQALGEQFLDARSDLYAVGCVAYWLLTGTLVFKGGTPIETIVMHVNHQPEPPSRRSPVPIPPELEAVVLACLAKRPEARPQTVDELAARLAAVRPPSEWSPSLAREWWSEHGPEVRS